MRLIIPTTFRDAFTLFMYIGFLFLLQILGTSILLHISPLSSKLFQIAVFGSVVVCTTVFHLLLCAYVFQRIDFVKHHTFSTKFYSSLLFWIFVISFLFLSYLGGVIYPLPYQWFESIKEFGIHIYSLQGMSEGWWPWIHTTYPYGLYPLLLGGVFAQIFSFTDALIFTTLLFNILAIYVYLQTIRHLLPRHYLWLSIVIIVSFLVSESYQVYYTGLHANWFRYAVLLLPCLAFSRFLYQPSARNVGIITATLTIVPFISPEHIVFVILSALPLGWYIYNHTIRRVSALIAGIFGIVTIAMPFISIVVQGSLWRNLPEVLSNIQYHSRFLLTSATSLSKYLPTLFTISSTGIRRLLDIYWVFVFYAPVVIGLFVVGVCARWCLQIGRARLMITYLLLTALVTAYTKALGASSASYALLSIPIAIILLAYVLQFFTKSSIVLFLITIIFLLIPQVYSAQQRLLPCLVSSSNLGCINIQQKSEEGNIVIDSDISFLQTKTSVDHTRLQLLKVIANNRVVVNFTDFQALSYYTENFFPHRQLFISLMSDEDLYYMADIAANAEIIILPNDNYNYIVERNDYINTIIASSIEQRNKISCPDFSLYTDKERVILSQEIVDLAKKSLCAVYSE